jgi:shikimate dehydrogenase
MKEMRRTDGDYTRRGLRQGPLAIVLIGMPGSGKSTLGRNVAKTFEMEFLDTDVLIEEYERRPITEIFKTDGEAYFRWIESRVIATVLDTVVLRESAPAASEAGTDPEAREEGRGLVLSVGGGAAEDPDNVALLRRVGIIVFIDRPLDALERSIAYNGNRPLLSDREKLVAQYERRTPLYAEIADRIIANDGELDAAAEELTQMARLMGAADDYLVIGDPIAHTLSPKLHSILFSELRRQNGAADAPHAALDGVPHDAKELALDSAKETVSDGATHDAEGDALCDASYGAVRVSPDQLEISIGDLRAGAVRGFNVTLPHKKAIVPLLDEVRGDAASAGAVNTVVREGDKLIGYNTDMEGLKLALEARGRTYAGTVVTVCGAGGAAAGVVSKAAVCGAARIYIVGRNEESAQRIAADAQAAADASNPPSASSVAPATDAAPPAPRIDFVRHDFAEPSSSPRLDEALAHTDIFINATPLGMDGARAGFAHFYFIEKLPEGAFVYDLVYKPSETRLVRAARARGLDAEGGLSMLIYQGILSDELFFGLRTDRRALYEAACDMMA